MIAIEEGGGGRRKKGEGSRKEKEEKVKRRKKSVCVSKSNGKLVQSSIQALIKLLSSRPQRRSDNPSEVYRRSVE